MEFKAHPDAISFRYQRDNSHGTTERASAIAYLWNGSWTQKDVPGNIVMMGNPTTVDMVDRDRCVLGKDMTGTQGGEVDPASDGVLVAAGESYYSEAKTTWTDGIIELNYGEFKNKEVDVEKINIIFSANDYFADRSTIVGSNSFSIDDVKLLYYHALEALSYKGANIDFNEETYNYYLSDVAYDESKLSYTKKGQGATVTTAYNVATALLTIRVEAEDYNAESNADAYSEYTIQFKKPLSVENYKNSLLVDVFGSYLPPSEKTVGVIHNADDSYSFSLENLELTGLGRIGDIVVNDLDVTENGETTNYSKENAMVYVELLQAEVPVTLQATETNGNLTASINIPLAPGSMEVNVTFAPALNVNSETTLAGTTGLYNITYTHTFPAGWSTVCLPFSTTQSEATLNAGQVQEFTAFADNTLTFNKLDINKSLTANTPYLVYYENETAVTLYGSSEDFTPAAVTSGDVTFTGNYTAGMSMVGLYGVAEQNGAQYIMKGGAGSKLGSTGAYFTVSGTTAGVNTLSLDIEGEGTTGIESIVAEEGQAFDVYTLTGVKVRTAATDLDGLQRGIYIVNGKKVLVK